MRLITTILWVIGALCWFPWLLLLIALCIELALGVSWDQSVYARPALSGIWPGVSFGWWPLWRLLSWQIISMWPISAVCGMALSAIGWRLYWIDQDAIMPRPAWQVAVSIAAPVIAPFIMWQDALHRHRIKETRLEREVQDARARIMG